MSLLICGIGRNVPLAIKARSGVLRRALRGLAALAVGISLASCGSSKQQTATSTTASASGASGVQPVTTTISSNDRAQASNIFSSRCAACHGPDGRGDGPGAANLNPKPRDFHDPAWQASVSDSQIESVIVYGGAAAGKSPLMVGNPDLANQPGVVAALRELIRKTGSQK